MGPLGRHSSQSGFTLLEMLSVLFIMALITGLVVVNLPGEPDGVEAEARALSVAANTAARDAIFEGQTHTLALSETGWSVREFRDRQWHVQSEAEPEARLRLKIEEAPVELSDEPLPHIVFEPTGSATPFAIELRDRGASWTVIGDEGGVVRVEVNNAR